VGTISVGFDGLRVTVRSPALEVVAEVERAFRAMIVRGGDEDDDARSVATLDVDRLGGGYELTGMRVVEPERGSLGEIRRAVRYHTTRAFVEARTERFWVHAAGACRGRRAMLLAGHRGRGKSTLVTSLARAGWRYLSDEAVPLDMADDRAAPFPLTPNVRIGSGRSLTPEAVAALDKHDVELGPGSICREAVRITELVFVRYVPGASASLAVATPGEAALELLESCLNFLHHGSRAVQYAADLARRLPATRLTFGDVDAAVRLLGSAADPPDGADDVSRRGPLGRDAPSR
jgi:hypothetical protein